MHYETVFHPWQTFLFLTIKNKLLALQNPRPFLKVNFVVFVIFQVWCKITPLHHVVPEQNVFALAVCTTEAEKISWFFYVAHHTKRGQVMLISKNILSTFKETYSWMYRVSQKKVPCRKLQYFTNGAIYQCNIWGHAI